MKGITIVRGDEAPAEDRHPVEGHRIEPSDDTSSGMAHCRSVGPPDYSLWMVLVEAPAGMQLVLPDVHGDECVYVRSGSLRVDGRVCPAGGAVIIESGAHHVVEVIEPSDLLHMGPSDPALPTDEVNGPVDSPGTSAHVVGPDGWFASKSEGRESKYFADSTCPTCRLTLLYTSRSVEYVSPAHSHSVDEIIHVLSGEIHVGSHVLGPGDTISVEADRRYGFRAPSGFGFLNYRRAGSKQTVARGSEPIVEGARVHGFDEVLDFR